MELIDFRMVLSIDTGWCCLVLGVVGLIDNGQV